MAPMTYRQDTPCPSGVKSRRLVSPLVLANGPRQNLSHTPLGHSGDALVADLGDPLVDRGAVEARWQIDLGHATRLRASRRADVREIKDGLLGRRYAAPRPLSPSAEEFAGDVVDRVGADRRRDPAGTIERGHRSVARDLIDHPVEVERGLERHVRRMRPGEIAYDPVRIRWRRSDGPQAMANPVGMAGLGQGAQSTARRRNAAQ